MRRPWAWVYSVPPSFGSDASSSQPLRTAPTPCISAIITCRWNCPITTGNCNWQRIQVHPSRSTWGPLPRGQSLSRRKLQASHTRAHVSLCRPAKHLKASEAKTKMRVRKRTSRSRDSQNPPDKTPFPTRPRGAPPRNCALFMKAEVRVSLVVELVPERVEEVLRIVYLQGSSVSQKPGRQRDVLATAFQCIFPLSLRRARPDPVHCHRRVLCPHLWATLGIEADGSMAFSSVQFSSVQFCRSVVSDSLRSHGLQHARLPCPPTPRARSNSCPSSRWCHPAISSSAVPFSSCPQSFPASGSFPRSQFFASGGQSIGVSASASVLPVVLALGKDYSQCCIALGKSEDMAVKGITHRAPRVGLITLLFLAVTAGIEAVGGGDRCGQ